MNVKLFSRFFTMVLILTMSTSTAYAQVSPPANTAAALQPQNKLSYRLAALAASANLRGASSAIQASTLSLPERGPGSIMRSGSQIIVNLRMADVSDPAIQALKAAGARIVHISARYQSVAAMIDAVNLHGVANLPAVLSVEEEFTPQTGSRSFAAPGQALAPTISGAPPTNCPQGADISEGDVQLKANLARANLSLTGSAVKVGILSDSYNTSTFASTNAGTDILTGDLPGALNTCGQTTPIHVLDDSIAGTDEGRGMLQIVHDLAPDAQLSFTTAFKGLFSFADNIRALRNVAGADIIADDVFYAQEPFFQEGPINAAISDVVNNGALYFTLAGNHNIILGGNNVSSYEAPAFRPTACPTAVQAKGELDCHNFATAGAADPLSRINLGMNGFVTTDFQWAEPWYGVTTDLNLYLLDSSGAIVASSAYDNIKLTQKPFEYMYYKNTSAAAANFDLVIARHAGTALPRLKYIFLQNTDRLNSVEYNISTGGDIVGPTLYGHSATTSGISVGAVPYNNSAVPEDFTSRGPSIFYFGPVTGVTPAAPIPPVMMSQPDIAATDGGCTTFFGNYFTGCNRFYGTSAATPHAAAAAALILQKARAHNIPMNRGRMIWALQTTAQAVSGGTAASVGAGLVNAYAAAGRLDSLLNRSNYVFMPAIQR